MPSSTTGSVGSFAGTFGRGAPSAAVAVVGVGLRLPGGVSSLASFWEFLTERRDAVGEVPQDRFDAARFTAPDPRRPGKAYTAAGGFLDDVAGFDADYFGISPKEAARIDPQHRLVLECAVEALDDAAIDPAALAGGQAAVVVGLSSHEYLNLRCMRPRTASPYDLTGGVGCNAANRVSYHFDWHGPSFTVDTACSSSLTAVHQACETLRGGRSPVALAGGVNVIVGPGGYVGFSKAAMLSPTGRCRPFAADADGFVRAEGAGVLVLKPLRDALADGDRVHAVVAGSAVNSDGRTIGLAFPGREGQAGLLKDVYAACGIAPRDVAYVETHGTGTPVGDPVECEALAEAFAGRERPLPVGGVKSQLGHAEAAAGIAGLAKAVLVLRHGRIPATLHAEPLSEAVDFAGLNLEPATTERPLRATGRAVVGVNSFGFGGANAHVVLAAGPEPEPERDGPPSGDRVPLLVSARTAEAVARAAADWADLLEAPRPPRFYDVAYTSARRRGLREHRIAVLAANADEAVAGLRAAADGRPLPGTAVAEAVADGRIGFAFCGNGALWDGAGAALLHGEPAFRDEVAALDEVLRPLLGWSVLEELDAPAGSRPLARTEFAQPLLFAVQAGLVAALAARGVRPHAVTGHSVGEVAAAYCAGVLDREGACAVIAARSRCQAATAGSGRMAAVGLDEAAAAERLARAHGRLVIAGVNSDRDVTVAGDAEALAALGRELAERQVFFRDLGLDYAFHSPAMDGLSPALEAALAGVAPRPGNLPLVSSVTGRVLPGTAAGADYWWRNVREPVRFADSAGTLLDHGCDALVEIGPHPVLAGYLRRTAAGRARRAEVVPTLSRSDGDPGALDTAVARLAAAGARLAWDRCFPRPGRVVDLPAYPWQRERHWSGEPHWWDTEPAEDAAAAPDHPLLGVRRSGPAPSWRHTLEPAHLPWLADHRVGGGAVLPAATFVDMALSAGRTALEVPAEVVRLAVTHALPLDLDDPALHLRLRTAVTDGVVTVHSREGSADGAAGDWTGHTRGHVRPLLAPEPPALDLKDLHRRLTDRCATDGLYRETERSGLSYGPAFRVLTSLACGEREALADYRLADGADPGHTAHPTVLDGALQACGRLIARNLDEPAPFLPTAIATIRCWRTPPPAGVVYGRLRTLTSLEAVWDVDVADEAGHVAVRMHGCRLRRFDAARPAKPPLLREVLRAAPRPGPTTAGSPPLAVRDIVRACAGDLAALADDWRTMDYPRFHRVHTHYTAARAAATVRELLPGRTLVTEDDLAAAGVTDRHLPQLRRMLDLAARAGAVDLVGDGTWRLAADPPDPEALLREAMEALPPWAMVWFVAGVCGRHFTQVIRGLEDPLELLFSENDHLAARIYETPGPRYQNRITARLLRELSARQPADRPLRVLEIGAGTGGTTADLLPVLPADRTHYTFTDVSPAFLPRAQARFAAYDFVTYRTLDLNADPVEQGYAEGSFDVVVAANSLHTARDISRALGRTATLLADGGHLLASEFHDDHLLLSVAGLLGGYGDVDDTRLRPRGSLTISPDAWLDLLVANGFPEPVRLGDARSVQEPSVLFAARAPRPPRMSGPPGPRLTDARWITAIEETAAPSPLAARVTGRLRHAAAGATAHVGNPGDPAAWQRALPAAGTAHLVLYLDGTPPPDAHAATEQAVRHCGLLRALATACAHAPEGPDLHVWLVQGFRREGSPAPEPAHSAAWGAARTLANEQPRLTVRRVALLHDGTEEHARRLAGQLVRELSGPSDEDEVVLTGHGRFVPRLTPHSDPVRLSGGSSDDAYRLAVDDIGLRYRLAWRPAAVPTPAPGQVVVSTRAAGLNYRDVAAAAGLVPGAWPDRPVGGLECAGVVAAVGPDVTDFSVGDRVAGMGRGCLGSHALCRADGLLRVPADMSFAEAATLPVVLATVHHSLVRLAGLRAGETLLVHGGAGGVGLAALRLARHLGARVIATAGTPAKRDLLRILGAEHALDSRTPHFADEVRDRTGGRGVDVVLNSLTGEAMRRSLELLAPGGRFVELGKRDVLADRALPLAPFEDNVAFFCVDLGSLWTDAAPALVRATVRELQEALDAGIHRPLPYSPFPAARVAEAFTRLQHSRHIGKLVITFDDPAPVPRPPAAPAPDPDGVHLIVGGLSGFGAAIARDLAAHGARRLVLVGRRGADGPEAEAVLDALHGLGAAVAVFAADAGDPEAMGRVLADVDASGRRLAGVVHAAMVQDDAPLTELDDERLRAVLHPKIAVGHVLDRLTRGRDLDYFLVLSSVAAAVGNRLQAPYCAGNLALDALVRDRRRAGLPATSVQWGAVSGAGYVERTGMTERLAAVGLRSVPADDALALLRPLLGDPGADVVGAASVDWGTLRHFLPALDTPRTRYLLPADGGSGDHADLRSRLAGATAEEALALIEDSLAELLARVLHTTPDRIHRDRRLDRLGVDSLMAAELGGLLHRSLGPEVPVLELAAAPSLSALARRVVTRLGHRPPDTPDEPERDPG
ncbi:type I polyketide synthase [Streptomyces huiliensis]|uniref:type I polyketide synthase n=1 Tax=Streptomyces huiliensis TaxID=2876027 RepID=UPI001CBAA46D|nr:type I polyketide synthase [Streptomyces huiliensis]MBZ4320425.1 SDR family NAD(P)-dependent oxidoreductase [Streptomyces huiliensis]